jgi:uncharacterized membrane protein
VIEAATTVLAVGVTAAALDSARCNRGTAALVVVVAALGPAVSSLPIDVLRLVVGGLLLIFGLRWLLHVIVRASGYVPLRAE